MTSPAPTPAYQGRISGRIPTDIRGAMFMPLHGTCLSGTDIRSDIRGYPKISWAFVKKLGAGLERLLATLWLLSARSRAKAAGEAAISFFKKGFVR